MFGLIQVQDILVKAFLFSFHITKNSINVQYVTIHLDLSENQSIKRHADKAGNKRRWWRREKNGD